MSRTVEVSIVCDVCEDTTVTVPPPETVDAARLRLARDGWEYRSKPWPSDTCPNCVRISQGTQEAHA